LLLVKLAPIIALMETTVHAITKSVALTPAITAGAYSADDALGGLLDFADIMDALRTGVAFSLLIIDEAKQSANLKLILFDQTFTATADNAALNISDADALNIVAIIDIPAASYVDVGGSTVAVVNNIGAAIKASGSSSIFGQLQTKDAPTYLAVDDITAKLTVLAD